MSSVLIVEDDDDKAGRLRGFIEQSYDLRKIVIAKSLQTGLRAALSGGWDLMLLDMTMTNFDRSPAEDGGRPHHFAGREILRRLQREEVRVPTIIVTQFGRFGEESEQVTLSELKAELQDRFSDYLGTVHYQSNIDEWKEHLSELICDKLPVRAQT